MIDLIQWCVLVILGLAWLTCCAVCKIASEADQEMPPATHWPEEDR